MLRSLLLLAAIDVALVAATFIAARADTVMDGGYTEMEMSEPLAGTHRIVSPTLPGPDTQMTRLVIAY